MKEVLRKYSIRYAKKIEIINRVMNIRIVRQKIMSGSFMLVLFASIISTSGYPLTTTEISKNFYIFTGVLILMYGFKVAILGKINKNKKIQVINWVAIGLIAVSLPSLVMNAGIDNVLAWIKYVIVILFASIFAAAYNAQTAAKLYVRVMVALSLISTTVYLLVNFFGLELTLPQFINQNDMLYKNGIVFFVYDEFLQWRNPGPFWEPGIYGSYLFVALVINLFVRKFNSLSSIILIVAMISTMSAASFILLGLIALLLLTKNEKSSMAVRIATRCVMAVILLVGILHYEGLIETVSDSVPSVFGKFIIGSESVTDRLDSPMTNIDIFLSSPLFGYGLAEYLNEYQRLTMSAQTSSLTALLAAFGVFGILHTLIWIIGIIMMGGVNITNKMILITAIIFILNKEPHYYFTLSYIIMFYITSMHLFPSFLRRGQFTVSIHSKESPRLSRQEIHF